jgi:hypothetical protein
MTVTASAPASRQSGFNKFMSAWLDSPLGFLAGSVVLIKYTGRVSGRARRLPVNCELFENGFLIRVGKPEEKTWWRNFRQPWPIEIVRKGRRIRGSAVVALGSTGTGQRVAAEYFVKHRGAAKRAGLPNLHRGELPTPEQLQAAAGSMVFVIVNTDAVARRKGRR